MPRLLVITPDGSRRLIDARPGVSIMESIRNAGISELAALCGGCRSCATCHVYFVTERPDLLPPVTDDEDELLDASDHRRENSRLSCQIVLTDEMGAVSVEIAPDS